MVVAPYAINLPFVRNRVADAMTQGLATEVTIGGMGWSWFSGFELRGLRIQNPPGFDQDLPLLELGDLRGDLALLQLVRGRVDLQGTAAGLVVHVLQDEQGRSNVEALGGATGSGGPGGGGQGRVEVGGEDLDLAWLRCDLELVDGRVEIRRGSETLESLQNLDCSVQKEFGTQVLAIDLSADLHRPAQPDLPGRLALRADVNAETMVVDSQLTAAGLELQRYRPLLAAFLQPGDLTELRGVVNGTVKARANGREGEQQVLLEGSLTVDAPRLAGALLQGMDVQAPKWTLSPNLTIALGKPGELPRIEAERLAADLGFATLRGLTQAELQAELPGKTGLGMAWTADLDALAAFGGPMPALLKGAGGRAQGRLALPIEGGALPDLARLPEILRAQADLRLARVAMAGFELQDLASTLTVADGKAALQTGAGTRLNTGPLTVSLQADLQQLDRLPFEFTLRWQGGRVAGEAADLLRYAVPLLAGVDHGLGFQSGIDMDLTLKGPSLRQEGETWLQFFNAWTGHGDLALSSASLTPAPALQGLLQAAGQGDGRLSMDRFAGGFTMRLGAVESQLLKWETRSRTYHLQGKTRLDGTMDWGIDLADLLKDHRDGQKVLAALGNTPIRASLTGSLDAPKLGMPDIAGLIQTGLQKAAQDLLRGKVDEILPGKVDDLLKQAPGILNKPPGGGKELPSEPKDPAQIIQQQLQDILTGRRRGNGQ